MRIWVLREGVGGDSASEGSAGPTGLGEALGPYLAAPGPLSQADQERWAANGLRLVRVPVDQLGGVQAALGSPGAIQRQWLGEHPEWMELLRGPQTGRQVVSLDSGLMSLDPGRLRLLGRCWVSPRLPRAGALPLAEVRVDLALQHQPPARARSLRELVDRPGHTPIEQAGVVFSRFVLELGLSGEEALLIVPERPEVVWGEGAAAAGTSGPTEVEGPPALPVGPPAPRLPTLGEAMLWSDAGDLNPRGARPVRVIIALIPRLPERLELAAAPNAR